MDLPSSENLPPSTPQPAVFSDDATVPSSPPSSPPGFPWDSHHAPKTTPQPPPRTALSVLGKRKVLSSISDNARPTKKLATTAKADKPGLTQMQISLGQQVQKRCKTCGMEYVPSSAEDRKLHDKYHKQNIEGYDVGKDFTRNARAGTVSDGAKKGDAICLIDGTDKAGRRRKAQAILGVAQRELGAVEIDEGDVWDAGTGQDREPKYRHHLYLRGTKCIGYLLVETIQDAREVLAPPEGSAAAASKDDCAGTEKANNAIAALQKRRKAANDELRQAEASPIELSETATDAQLGVSRIWVSPTHRRQNIATALLNAALDHHNAPDTFLTKSEQTRCEDGDLVQPGGAPSRNDRRSKELVAFSQPTESGARLARRWFGKTYGWKVYVD